MYQISFYVPVAQAESVKEAMFRAGAGRLGNYECCSFEYSGVGQFRPLLGSHPHIGDLDKLEKVSELKIEMICQKEYLTVALDALKASHPYETPAYFVTQSALNE